MRYHISMRTDNGSTKQELLTLQETADLFRVTSRTIRRWIKNGKINQIKFGRTIRISQEEINRIKGL